MNLVSNVLVTPPRVEPVSLTELKEHLRILPENAEDDAHLQTLIATARSLVESRLGYPLHATQYRATFELRPSGGHGMRCICGGCTGGSRGHALPMGPVLNTADHPITLTLDGDTMASDGFTVDIDQGTVEPVDRSYTRAVVTYWAGVAPGGYIAPQAKVAILLLAAHWYEHRTAVVSETGAQVLPMAVDALLASVSRTGRY